jgi:hypothetical protein
MSGAVRGNPNGPSGSGKSTLMHCLAGLDTVTSGSVSIGDIELAGLSDKKMTALRRDRIGFVFHSFNLVRTLTALENITLPTAIAGRRRSDRRHRDPRPAGGESACWPPCGPVTGPPGRLRCRLSRRPDEIHPHLGWRRGGCGSYRGGVTHTAGSPE